nr:YdeI/OmpD-associated family protein [Candidatus Solirubrobacter pratensis]
MVPLMRRYFASRQELEAWLEDDPPAEGVWVLFPRARSGAPGISHAEALEAALCFGWIDAQKGVGDETHWCQRFMPRTKRSIWSKVNRAKAEALIASGAMRPSGLAEVERAKADGRWDGAYDAASTATVPDDLAEALEGAGGRAFFDALNSRNRYAILHRVQTAKKPETRARRIGKFAAMCAAGERIYP